MSAGGLRLVGAIPGASQIAPLIAELERTGGVVTAFSDSMLPPLHEMLGEDARSEVLPFGGVVAKVVHLLGEPDTALAQKGLVLGAIEAACLELPDGSCFRPVAEFAGLHRRIAEVLEELREFGYTPTMLDRAAEGASALLSNKLRSLSEIERKVRDTLTPFGRIHNSDQMHACLGTTLPEAKLERLLVFGGSSYEPLKLEWVRWLADNGAEVTLVLDRAASPGLFEEAARSAVHLGWQPEPVGSLNRLTQNLFAGDHQDTAGPEVRVINVPDPLAEAEWALREAVREIRDGRAPGSIGIYVRSLQDYASLLEAAAARHDVPLKMTRRSPLVTNGFVRLLLSALEACAGNDVRVLGAIARNSYAAVPESVQQELGSALRESYAQKDEQWRTLREWAALNKEQIPWLETLLDWRSEVLAAPASLGQWKSRLEDVVHRLDWLSTSLEGPLHLRARDVRARNAFQRVLAQRASVQQLLGDRRMGLSAFAAECRRLWTEEDFSVPSRDSGIQVASSAEAFGPVQSLYVLGMLEGVFPRRRSEEPILTDDDRRTLHSLLPELPPLPDSHTRARKERDEFYRVCAAPTERLTLSYPLTDEERDNVPAFYLSEVERVSPVVKISRGRSEWTPEDSEFRTEADQRLAQALAEPAGVPVQNRLESQEAVEALRAAEATSHTPSQLREVLECPFRHLARHRLRLDSRHPRSRWSSLRHLPQKVQLATAPSREEARERLMRALEAEIETHFPDADGFDLAIMQAGGRRLVDEWVEREFEARKLWPKEAGSVVVNPAFGSARLRAEIPVKEVGSVRLSGGLSSIAAMGRYNVGSMTERIRPKEDDGQNELSEQDRFEMGLYLMAMFEKGRLGALEVDSFRGIRTLYLLPRAEDSHLPSRHQDGYRVVDLGDPGALYGTVKALLAKAMERLARNDVYASPAEHCRWCDYGELCRSSSEFGEDTHLFDHANPEDSD